MRTKIRPLFYALVLIIGVVIGVNIAPDASFVAREGSPVNVVDEVFSYVEQDYADSVDWKKLQTVAITKALETLDPHSEYIPQEYFAQINDPLMGSFEGIGVSFRIDKDTIHVASVIKGGPSEKAGIKAGDRIVYVDDTLVAGVKIDNQKVMRKLKGPKGTEVILKVCRRQVPELLTFTLKRDVIPTYSVDASFMLDDTLGYVKISKFAATTHKEFVKATRELRREGMKHLVIDLRDNGGGFLEAAVNIADEILAKGTLIVYTDGLHRDRQYIFASRRGELEDMGITVLIDEGSASASEILAGAIQDNDRGTIVGRRSFGKALVQEQMMLSNNDALRLTVAHYYTPTGRCIQKPYDGDIEKYVMESYDRYLTGELFSADSIHQSDTQRFVTPHGKIVYGGGGITPDRYIPLKNDSTTYYANRVANAGIVFSEALDYVDKNRQRLEKMSKESFIKSFVMPEICFQNIINQAEKKGLKGTDEEKQVLKRRYSNSFKAYVGREIYDDATMYLILMRDDEMIKSLREKNVVKTLSN